MKYVHLTLAAILVASAPVAMIMAKGKSGWTLDNSTRPAADVERDAARKPAEMATFARIKPGQTVVDLIPGRGYFTRVFSQAVGPKGTVIAFIPDVFAAKFPKAVEGFKTIEAEPAYKNVKVTVASVANIAPANSVDRIWTSQNYHDLHNQKDNEGAPADVVGVNKAIFAALKPGGIYVVLDHSAVAGSGLRDTETMHRIDEASVKSEVLAAGFKFDGISKILANPADDRSKGVFDPAIRGKTDQFILRFVKPKK
jgi:predicted methyltransferase